MKKFTLIFVLTCITFCSIFAQNGLKTEYYNGTNFNQYVGTQIQTEINQYWKHHAPLIGMDPGECSVRWTGRLMSPKTGEITFSARVDDGIRVWVGGVQVIDNWQLNDVGYSRGTVRMEEGKYYDIKVEYFNALHEAEIRLFWIMPKPENMSWYESFWYDEKEEIVPASHFFQPIEEKIPELKEEEEKPINIVSTKPIKKPTKDPVKPQKMLEAVIESYIPKNVEFERAKSEILSESFPELDKLAAYLIKNPQHKIRIEGHTDNVGDAKKNVELSHSRARAVAAYLIKKGVHHERLSAQGFGGSRPLVKSVGGEYHPENRRVEFIVE